MKKKNNSHCLVKNKTFLKILITLSSLCIFQCKYLILLIFKLINYLLFIETYSRIK